MPLITTTKAAANPAMNPAPLTGRRRKVPKARRNAWRASALAKSRLGIAPTGHRALHLSDIALNEHRYASSVNG